jgi:hypothetical protein
MGSVRPQNKHLKPFPKGTSGNPAGAAIVQRRFQERFQELKAELEATGIPLTAREHVDLEMAVALSLRRSRSVLYLAQAAATAKRLLDSLYDRRMKSNDAVHVPLRSRLAAEAEPVA